MEQIESNKTILYKYIPEKAVETIAQWIYKFDFKLKIKRSRQSKYGDYRPPMDDRNHTITINHDLNKYAFLITLVHEIAHLTNFNKNRNRVKPHGNEWKTEFKLLMNVFFEMNKFLARMMNKYPDYDVSMEELHHVHKKDAPSGTGITIAEGIMEHFSGKKKYSIKKSGDREEIFIEVVRDGEIPGTHIVKYHSDIDDIIIKHIAHNRKGFALGAVLAAEYMNGKKGIFGMKDLMGF